MNCALIESTVALAHGESSLEDKLVEYCRMLLGYFPFDQCLVYRRAPKGGGFTLVAAAGEGFSRVRSYAAGVGLPGALAGRSAGAGGQEHSGPVSASMSGDGVWHMMTGPLAEAGVAADPGLDGFASCVVVPVSFGKALDGLVYLKSTGDAGLAFEDAELLRISALLLANIVRCATLLEGHAEEHRRLEELEERLLTAEKFLGIGDVAAILAHEVKSPIISIGALAKKIRKSLGERDPADLRYVDLIIEEVHRVEGIISGVIRFLRDNTVELALDDANRVVEEVLHIFHEEMEENSIRVERRLCPEPLPVMTDHEQLKIAFDNFISNAIQSMANSATGDGGSDGTLTVSTERAGDIVIIRVSDTGGGIDPGDIDHIFNPFFTTKERGTGLGLAITKSIVMRHRGIIEVENDAGRGVSFAVKLPYAGGRRAT